MKKNKKGNFNSYHPELLEGEIFLRNIDPNRIPVGGGFEFCNGRFESTCLDAFGENPINAADARILALPTVRFGEVAYDKFGIKDTSLKPVFIQKAEYEKVQ